MQTDTQARHTQSDEQNGPTCRWTDRQKIGQKDRQKERQKDKQSHILDNLDNTVSSILAVVMINVAQTPDMMNRFLCTVYASGQIIILLPFINCIAQLNDHYHHAVTHCQV